MPRALQPPRVCRLLRLGDCGRTECCGSRLSVRLDYPSQQLVNARVLARAGPGPLTHWPWPSCGSCQLSAHRLGNGCSQCGRSAVRPACMPINHGGCVFQVCNLRGVLWLGRAARAGKWPALLCVMPCRSPTPVHCGCPPSVLCCRVCAASPWAVTACGYRLSRLSLLHRPRLLVPLTCPKPGPNRRCALAGATLFGQVGH